jgi:hypothetical protein
MLGTADTLGTLPLTGARFVGRQDGDTFIRPGVIPALTDATGAVRNRVTEVVGARWDDELGVRHFTGVWSRYEVYTGDHRLAVLSPVGVTAVRFVGSGGQGIVRNHTPAAVLCRRRQRLGRPDDAVAPKSITTSVWLAGVGGETDEWLAPLAE